MQVKAVHERLLKSREFRVWRSSHPDDYLAHFLKIEEKEKSPWCIGYYNPESDRITTFTMQESIDVSAEEQVFKKDGAVKELFLKDVDVGFDAALSKVNDIHKKKYPAHLPVKVIAILQNIGDVGDGAVWNITLVTNTFHMLNVKVGASDGEIKSESMSSVMDLKAG